MVPLPWVGMGFVVLLLTARVHGYDLLADPLGWLLVLAALKHLPLDDRARGRLRAAARFAFAVAVVTWPAPVLHWLHHTDDSLVWAAGLPEVAVAALLCHELAAVARQARDARAARWFEVTRTLTVVAGIAPALVLGGRLHFLAVPAGVASVVAPTLLVVLLFGYAGRPWATAPAGRPDAAEQAEPAGPVH